MAYFPAFLNLQGKSVVVVGGGRVAERKVEKLLPFGPRIKVIAPKVTKNLSKLGEEGKVHLIRRRFLLSDLRGAFMVIVAVDDLKLQERIYRYSTKRGILCNSVDSPELCNFLFPALIVRGDTVVGISTSGKVPALSRALREYIQKVLPDNLEVLQANLEELRKKLPRGKERQRLLVRLSRKLLNLAE